MLVETFRFGALEVAEEELIQFPLGLPGFEHLKQFFFVPLPDNPAFVWLQAKADPAVAFLLVDPFLFFPGYSIELGEAEKTFLEAGGPEDILVYAVVTIPPSGVREMTANLLAPVVINRRARLGLQMILDGSGYTTKHRLFSDSPGAAELRRACGG